MKNEDICKIVKSVIEADASRASKEAKAGDEWITIMEARKITGFSRWAISRWIKKGLIRASKLGKSRSSRVRIDAASLRAYMERMVIKPKEA